MGCGCGCPMLSGDRWAWAPAPMGKAKAARPRLPRVFQRRMGHRGIPSHYSGCSCEARSGILFAGVFPTAAALRLFKPLAMAGYSQSSRPRGLSGLRLMDSDSDSVEPNTAESSGIWTAGLSHVQAETRGAKRRLGAFCGASYRSRGHMQYLHMCKRQKREREKSLRQQQEDLEPLQHAWNQERLRAGDMVGEAGVGRHPNAWSMQSVLRSAWLQIGKNWLMRAGVDGMRRGLAVVACVASAVHRSQERFIEEEMLKAG